MEKIRARDGSIACFSYSRMQKQKQADASVSFPNQMYRLDTIGDTGT